MPIIDDAPAFDRLSRELAIRMATRLARTASHRAMLMAVGEVGGIAAWKKFFAGWDAVRRELEDLFAADARGEGEASGSATEGTSGAQHRVG